MLQEFEICSKKHDSGNLVLFTSMRLMQSGAKEVESTCCLKVMLDEC